MYYVFKGAIMNDKAEAAKEYLEKLRHIHDYIKQLDAELGEIPFLSANQTDAIKIEKSFTGSSLPAAEKRLDKMAEYGRAVDRYIRLKHEILTQLEKLQNAQYEDVLYCRYVLFLSNEKTARRMNLEEAYASRVHVKALTAFAEILEARTDRSGEEPPTEPAFTLTAE